MAIWFDIQGCAFSSHKDSEWAVILFIKLSPFEWQYGLTYKAAPCRSNHIAILKDIGVVIHSPLKPASPSQSLIIPETIYFIDRHDPLNPCV